MPTFHIDLGDASETWNGLDRFTQSYIESVFWTELEHGTTRETWNPELHSSLPGDMTLADLAPETLEKMREDCADFQKAAAAELELALENPRYDIERAGIDFWLTRNRHGAGFWDRGLGPVGDKLTDLAHGYGEAWLYVGDDNLIYQG